MTATAERIRELRKKASLTQEQFGQIFGIVKATVSSYETGTSVPDDETKKRICKYFQVSCDYLIGLTDYPAKHPITEEDIKTALFGQNANVTEEMWNDLLKYAHFLAHSNSKERYMKFAKKLRIAMFKANIGTIALSEQTGISKYVISQYLDARIIPTSNSDTIKKLSEKLGVDLEWLINDDLAFSESDLKQALYPNGDYPLEEQWLKIVAFSQEMHELLDQESTQQLKIAARGGGVQEVTVTDSQLKAIMDLPEVKDPDTDKS